MGKYIVFWYFVCVINYLHVYVIYSHAKIAVKPAVFNDIRNFLGIYTFVFHQINYRVIFRRLVNYQLR